MREEKENTARPLDLGEAGLSETEAAWARSKHDLDRAKIFDARNDIDDRADTRADLLPEEGDSAAPKTQAREVLRDSDLRIEVPEAAPSTEVERRRSEETA